MKDIYRTFGIYKITNEINKVAYVGQTSNNFGDRWDNHKSLLRNKKHSNPLLQKDWDTYGEDNFKFEILEITEDPTMLDDLEIKHIEKQRSLFGAYNFHDGGSTGINLGKHLSDETKRKIGAKNRINMTGRHPSEITRQRMSEAQKRRVYSEEELQKIKDSSRNANLGRVRNDQTKQLLREINQKNPPSAKYTPDDIKNIRRLKSEGVKLADIASIYKTSPSYISNIVHFRRWGHIH